MRPNGILNWKIIGVFLSRDLNNEKYSNRWYEVRISEENQTNRRNDIDESSYLFCCWIVWSIKIVQAGIFIEILLDEYILDVFSFLAPLPLGLVPIFRFTHHSNMDIHLWYKFWCETIWVWIDGSVKNSLQFIKISKWIWVNFNLGNYISIIKSTLNFVVPFSLPVDHQNISQICVEGNPIDEWS